MKIIGYDIIKSLNIPIKTCYQWTTDMIRRKQECILPPKIHINLPGNVFCNIMPSVVDDIGGVKIVSRYPRRCPSLDSSILLIDMKTGDPLAYMDGNWITAIRTGCVAAHSIVNFANKQFETIGLIGLGNTMRSTLMGLCAAWPDKKMHVKMLAYKDQDQLFMNRFESENNLSFSVETDACDLVKKSEVVVSAATYFDEDICPNECYNEGVLVVPVHSRGFSNCDLFFDKVYADDKGHVDHFKYFDRFPYFAEVSDVVNGRAHGREKADERIIVYNIGISIHDINYAAHIYRMLEDREEDFGRLQEVNLHSPKEKFWV